MKTNLVFVLYDGIENSVFQSQVFQPLIKKLKQKNINKIIIISFEYKKIQQYKINKIISLKKNLNLITLKKIPYLGKLSLIPSIYKLKKILNQLNNYKLISRGPFASFICSAALKKEKCSSFIMQARGLCADEYQYSKKNEKNIFKKIFYWLRIKLFYNLEKKTYQNEIGTIEAVSPALKNYLIKTFNIKENRIEIAKNDIPKSFTPAQTISWRNEIRKKLNIPETTHVYCFNGSAKPWQSPNDIARFFIKQLEKNINSFLLILTQDKIKFQSIINLYSIPKKKHSILYVDHEVIYQYLSACDTGIIFREKHIINWISRPTKILEYQAVGLKIIHNNTISWITKDKLLQSHKKSD